MTGLEEKIIQHTQVDILVKGQSKENFVGRPFSLDYFKANILISDAWKHKVGGIPQGAFLLAFYKGEDKVKEALLLRALGSVKLPTDNNVISSMIEYYKDNMDISGRAGSGKESKLDQFTRYEFSFSGLECRVLGAFYETIKIEKNGYQETLTEFGADVENFYSANNYEVYKASDDVLKMIVNQRDVDEMVGGSNEFKIGVVRYSSSRRFQIKSKKDVEVYINPKDFLGKRTALFGMTRTGKSNTAKKVIQATVEISRKAKKVEVKAQSPFDSKGNPVSPVGQIIFDINGEYANPNLQDEGTAIYELYKDDVIRYSTIEKEGFKVMKVNFYKDVESGAELVKSHLSKSSGNYIESFLAVDFSQPDDDNDKSSKTRRDRRIAAYLVCLHKAGFNPPRGFTVRFQGNKDINKMVPGNIDPSKGITLQKAETWFTTVWENYKEDFFTNYKEKNGKEWADEELKAIMVL